MKRLTSDERERIRTTLLDGATVTQASRLTGFSRGAVESVARVMRAEGIGIHRSPQGRKPGPRP